MTRVLVVGGAGFVGSQVVRALAASGAAPTVFGPRMEGAEARIGGAAQIEGSVLSRADLDAALRVTGAEAVVSCAAFGAGRLGLLRSGEADGEAAMAVNVTGLAHLLQAARAASVERVVWTSSTVVYGPAEQGGEVDEDVAPAPLSFYGLTKMLAEQVSAYHRRRYGMSVCALRLPLVLGPGLWYEGAAASLAALFRWPPPASIAAPDGPADLAHVEDAAGAVLALLGHEAPAPVYNLVGFRARTSELIAAITRRRPGTTIRLATVPPTLTLPPVSDARLRADTGFVPRYDLDRFVDALLEQVP